MAATIILNHRHIFNQFLLMLKNILNVTPEITETFPHDQNFNFCFYSKFLDTVMLVIETHFFRKKSAQNLANDGIGCSGKNVRSAQPLYTGHIIKKC